MEMTMTRRIAAGPLVVWAFINDPTVLRRCMPGCRDVRLLSPTEMTVTVALRFGSVSATFRGRVNIESAVEPIRLTIVGQGSGGAAGSAQGRAYIRLEGKPGSSLLACEVKIEVSGRLARFGARRVDDAVQRFAGAFLNSLVSEVEAGQQRPNFSLRSSALA